MGNKSTHYDCVAMLLLAHISTAFGLLRGAVGLHLSLQAGVRVAMLKLN